MLELTIRQATGADADTIADLIAAIEPDRLVSELSHAERRDRFHEHLEAGTNICFVAESGGRLIGELTLALGGPAPTGLGFSVHPDFRRCGVAHRLLEHALGWSDAHGIHKLTAEVMAHNDAALALLGGLGFAQEGYLVHQFRRRSGDASDAVLLARVKD